MNALEITGLEELFLGLYLMAHGSIHVMFLFYHYDEKDNVYLGWSRRSWLLDKVIPQITPYIGKIIWISIVILFGVSGLLLILSGLDLLDIDGYLLSVLIIISSAIATLAFIVFYDGLSPTPFHWILGVVINLVLIAFISFFPTNGTLVLVVLILIFVYGMLFHSRIISKITHESK
ncbi:MAG: hypothetical protein JSV04_12600 [Candidatus Heimdallarchaeota archaeon]|nr:MAG: hypothetical protein JSV04_12600 [Candidatus Heimdallarchaeota archaeon]